MAADLDLDLPALIAFHEEMAQEPCPSCGGSGQTVVGENRVTEDMAIDAGDRSMAGMFHSYAYEYCDECGASGITEAAYRAQQTAAALRQLQSQGAAIRKLAEELRSEVAKWDSHDDAWALAPIDDIADKLSALAGGQETT